MKFRSNILIPIFVSLISLFILINFRTIPVSRLWKGYQVLYVFSNDLSEIEINTILKKNGCENVISRISQKTPVISNYSPVQIQSQNSYLLRRNAFFQDESKKANVFFIPDSDKNGLEKSLRELSAFSGTEAGTDGKSSFPWVSPIIVLVFSLLLACFSKNKILFVTGSFFPVALSFSQPLFTVSAASILFVFGIFLIHRLWGRKDFIRTLFASPYVVLFISLPLLLLIFASPVSALFYFLTTVASAAVLYLYYFVEENRNSKASFSPVYIRSSKFIPIVGKLGIRLMIGVVFSIILIFVVFRSAGRLSDFSASSARPALPSPVKVASSSLPDFDDFLKWSWNTVTYPYKKLTEESEKEVKDGDVVSITEYTEENGRIIPKETPVFIYNNQFREQVTASVENMDYPAVEKLILSQGKGTKFGFSKGTGVSTEKFGAILLGIFILIPTILCVYYIIGRKRYGLSI